MSSDRDARFGNPQAIGVAQVAAWLRDVLGLAQYAGVVESRRVNGYVLLDILRRDTLAARSPAHPRLPLRRL